MELLDSEDALKGHFLRKSAEHREQLEDDVRLITENTEKIIKNALIIGGALAVTYFVISRFSGSEQKSKKIRKVRLVKDSESEDHVVMGSSEAESPSIISQIGSNLASQAGVILLSLAKEKLSEFLQSQSAKKE
jgi:hypothetical protein